MALLGISLFFLPAFINFWMTPCIFTGHLSGHSKVWCLLTAGELGSKWGHAMACGAGSSPARAWPGCGLLIFPSFPSQHLCLGWLLQPARCDGPHAVGVRKIASSDFQSPATRRLVLAAQGVCWGWVWHWTITGDTGLWGVNRTQAFLLERWRSRHFFIKFLSSVLVTYYQYYITFCNSKQENAWGRVFIILGVVL